MPDDDKPANPPPRPGTIPRPPKQADIDQVSREQGMIADEWAGEPDPAKPVEKPRPK